MPHIALFRATLTIILVLLQGLCWAQAQGEAPGESPDWLDKPYGYLANNESLRSLLYEFGTALGIPVIVSTRINVVADDEIPLMSAREFLAEVHTRFGLIWVYDGTTLYLYDATEAAQETVEFPFARKDAFKAALDDADVQGVPLNWIFLPADNSMQISGPPRFVEWGKQLAEEIMARNPGGGLLADPNYVIRVFEVEYGYVDRMANSASGSKAPIVGLAEMIAKLMNVAHVSGVMGATRRAGTDGAVSRLRGSGVIPGDDPESRTQAVPAGIVGIRGAGEEAFVIGDPRLNAVIVRDVKSRMPVYEQLIAELDSPVDQIEITISVLDIDASAAEEMRFDLESDSLRVNAGADAGGSSIYYSENLWDVEGIALRIRALRNSGKSRILTRPSVTTLDNHEASFQNNRTFYVRLGGNDAEAVDLAPVSYGWVVRIRPHVIYDSEYKRVQLAIHIEDGNRGGADLAVTGVPEVAQNVIQTQAVVQEGNSLLIGGYTVREQTRFEQRIPWLGRIPIMGRLFSNKVDRDQSVARYFLITPRILPAMITYEINTGFEGEPLQEIDAVVPVPSAASPPPTRTDRPAPGGPPAGRNPAIERGPLPEVEKMLHSRPSVAAAPATVTTEGNILADYPPDYYAVQVIALSSAERLEAFVQANRLQEMLRVRKTTDDGARHVLIEGIYPDLSAATAAAQRLRGDGRFEVPYIRRLASLQAPGQSADTLVTGAGLPEEAISLNLTTGGLYD